MTLWSTSRQLNNDVIMKIRRLSSLTIIGMLFFLFGFVTWLNGTLIPFLKITCELSYTQALLVTFAFYIAYVVLAFPASSILRVIGFKRGMAAGLWVMALGSAVFIPAASLRSYGVFLIGLFIQGAGLALLQTAANPYVTRMGPPESAARRISIMGICNKFAGALSPVILGAFILQDVAVLEQQLNEPIPVATRNALLNSLAKRVMIPYAGMTLVLILLGIVILYAQLPDYKAFAVGKVKAKQASIWSFHRLLIGAVAMFLYVGAEVIAGDTITQYGLLQGINLQVAKNFTSFTLVCMLFGYLLGIVAIPRYISQQNALKICALSGIFFSTGILLTSGWISVLFVALLGLSNSLIWPAIFPLAIEGLGSLTEKGSALLVMGIGGGAIVPLLYGKLGELIGEQQAYGILIPCYMFILAFGIITHKQVQLSNK